ncbi:hypothetical protein EIN_153240 [Entamoeba invadens IP1]|uniref:MRH domain-containing protein n=1 Tax=Entamoeba invadens IP1 TaxID=370355 RepID=A0A0A1U8Z1_ENTIV|nr:hypothetical protein EIN_153240 [Entamoeba invadens IP1]ELP91317.1 hypothetical protein EIN_153240 [Entamoeba invadens IP1]|eukprot:XP_004258088.1 hypothetical protein EIN_153240 [Entamoeba invadens IP1]
MRTQNVKQDIERMGYILQLFLLLICSSRGQFPMLQLDIELLDRCYNLPTGIVKTFDMNGKIYKCSIPRKQNVNSSVEEFHKLQKESSCLAYNNGYYNYIFCPGYNLTQQRIVNGQKISEIVLGRRVSSVKISKNSVREEYVDGNLCLGKGQRSFVVNYICMPDQIPRFVFAGMEEDNCKYTFKFQVPKVCSLGNFEEWNMEGYVRCCQTVQMPFL